MCGVVDPRPRVYAVENLRIADARVMLEIPSGNVDSVVIMIGKKAPEFIAVDHGVKLRW